MSGACGHIGAVTCDNCRPALDYWNMPPQFVKPQGWECPKCGRVYAPFYPSCDYCGKPDLSKPVMDGCQIVPGMDASTQTSLTPEEVRDLTERGPWEDMEP